MAEAEQIYQLILAEDPQQPDAVHLLGLIRMEQERDEEAVELMERALELFPAAPHFHHNIAGLYRRLGRLTEAEARFRRAIELKPDYGEAYQGLAEMVRFESADPLFDSVGAQLKRAELPDAMRSYFHFAAGKMFDDTGHYPTAFTHYQAGNQLARRQFDSVAHRSRVKDIIYTSSATLAARVADFGLPTQVPVFIVGMPRSGTTLVEQILASHSQVFGAGELNEMKQAAALTSRMSAFKQPFPNSLPGLSRDHYQQLAASYLQRVQMLAETPGVARIIDKHPLNFQFIGLIFSLFPQARIIHTVRNPLDTCLSCFFQNFTKGQDYSFDLPTLGHFYNDYRRLMEHWESVYPGRIHTLAYEDVLDDQETRTRELLDYLGLEFEQGCIDFHETDRKVSTASFLQVRKPLYRSSQARWKRYQKELEVLARIIGIRLDPPVTISVPGSSLS